MHVKVHRAAIRQGTLQQIGKSTMSMVARALEMCLTLWLWGSAFTAVDEYTVGLHLNLLTQPPDGTSHSDGRTGAAGTDAQSGYVEARGTEAELADCSGQQAAQ